MIDYFEDEDFDNRVCGLVGTKSTKQLGKLKVSKLAKEMDMSVSCLYKHFKKEFITGDSPGVYILYWKISIAKELMKKNPEISIKELSNKLGYSRTDYFISLFKLIENCTPGTLLKKHRKELNEKREKARLRKAKSRQQAKESSKLHC